jgi:amino acid transporter
MSHSILISLAALGTVVALVVLALAVFVIRDRRSAARRVESLFRRPARPAQKPGPDHYYKPYWS